jgi:hypothetical protein
MRQNQRYVTYVMLHSTLLKWPIKSANQWALDLSGQNQDKWVSLATSRSCYISIITALKSQYNFTKIMVFWAYISRIFYGEDRKILLDSRMIVAIWTHVIRSEFEIYSRLLNSSLKFDLNFLFLINY